MKFVLIIMLIFVGYCSIQAQQSWVISTINNTRGSSCIVIKTEIEIVDTLLIVARAKILDYLILSDTSLCYIVEVIDGAISYEKFKFDNDGVWRCKSIYNLGYFPMQSMYVPNRPSRPIYDLLKEDVIEATEGDRKYFINLPDLEKQGNVVFPKY